MHCLLIRGIVSYWPVMRKVRWKMVRIYTIAENSCLHLSSTLYYSPVCDSYVRPETLVRICDECNFGTYGGRCIICGAPGKIFHFILKKICVDNLLGISDAYYCAGCTRLEKDRDGCPKIVNLGASRTDLFYERRRLGTSHPSMFEKISTHFTFAIRFQKGIDGVFIHHRTSTLT